MAQSVVRLDCACLDLQIFRVGSHRFFAIMALSILAYSGSGLLQPAESGRLDRCALRTSA